MKKNNKGFTLIELIVSITLISVIMVFMFTFLSDVTFEKDNEFFASKNQQIRQEVISLVAKAARYNYNLEEGDEYVNPLTLLTVNGNSIIESNTTKTNITTIKFGDGTKNHTLTIEKNENRIKFTSAENKKYAWTLKQGKIDSTTCTSKVNSSVALVECIVKVFTENDNNTNLNAGGITIDNNNSLDDFVFDFLVKK